MANKTVIFQPNTCARCRIDKKCYFRSENCKRLALKRFKSICSKFFPFHSGSCYVVGDITPIPAAEDAAPGALPNDFEHAVSQRQPSRAGAAQSHNVDLSVLKRKTYERFIVEGQPFAEPEHGQLARCCNVTPTTLSSHASSSPPYADHVHRSSNHNTKSQKNLVVVIHPYDRTRPTNTNLCVSDKVLLFGSVTW